MSTDTSAEVGMKLPRKGMLASAWKAFTRNILDPVGAGSLQRRETKRAFYLGAYTVYRGIIDNMGDGNEPTDEDIKILDDLYVELDAFIKSLKEGRI